MVGQTLAGLLRNWPWRIVVVGVVVILLAAGIIWWKTAGSADDQSAPTFEERAKRVQGVRSVRFDSKESEYRIKVSRGIRADRLAHIFNKIDASQSKRRRAIVYDFENFDVHDGAEGLTSIFRNGRRAADVVVSAIKMKHVIKLDIDSSHVTVILDHGGRILPAADRMLDNLDGEKDKLVDSRHTTLKGLAADKTFRNHEQQRMQTRLDRPQVARKRVHRLREALKKVDGRFLQGFLDDPMTATVSIKKRTEIKTAREAVRSVFPKDPPELNVYVDSLTVTGDGPVKPALRLVRRLEKVGATVKEISTHRKEISRVELNTDEFKRAKRVLSVLGDKDVLKSDPDIEFNSSGQTSNGSNVVRPRLKGKAHLLARNARLFVNLYKLGYSVNFVVRQNPELQISPRQDDDNQQRYLADLDEREDREHVVTALRSAAWHHSWLLQIVYQKSVGTSEKGDLGLRFNSTVGGKAHKVLYPGQLTKNDAKTSALKRPASQLLRQWNATAN